MQALPALPLDGRILIAASNNAQQRGAHGAFRYFGKLAPDVTGRVLELAASRLDRQRPHTVIDVMCGSGTTLIEASDRGWPAIGVDVNPVALLYGTAKTTAVSKPVYRNLLTTITTRPRPYSSSSEDQVFAQTRNAIRWFEDRTRRTITELILILNELDATPEKNLLRAVLLSRIRRWSNASARTGRLFYDPASATADPLRDFEDSALAILTVVPDVSLDVHFMLADARSTPLKAGTGDIVFCHPPYFALYRYSSDVLRFELELGGYSRSQIARTEIRDGWKSGDPANLADYLADMGDVLREAARLVSQRGVVALVAANSTLGAEQLPVIDGLAEAASESGLAMLAHYERVAHHGSATYHRSARSDKVVQRDHVLLLGSQQHVA